MYGILKNYGHKNHLYTFFQLQLYLIKYRSDNVSPANIYVLMALHVMHKNKNIITAPVGDGCWGTIDSIFPYDPEH